MIYKSVYGLAGVASIAMGLIASSAQADEIEYVSCYRSEPGKNYLYYGGFDVRDGKLQRRSSQIGTFEHQASRISSALRPDGQKFFPDKASLGLLFRDGRLAELGFSDSPRVDSRTKAARFRVALMRDGKAFARNEKPSFDGMSVHPSFPPALAEQLTAPFEMQVEFDGKIIGVSHFSGLKVKDIVAEHLALLRDYDQSLIGQVLRGNRNIEPFCREDFDPAKLPPPPPPSP